MASLDAILKRLRLERSLNAFQPHLAGPHTIGFARPGDPLQIRCRAPDLGVFRDRLRAVYGDHPGFSLTDDGCTFSLLGTAIQVTGAPEPPRAQAPVRRQQVIVRLLRSIGAPLHRRVSENHGESAIEAVFATAMGVGDVLELERATVPQLRAQWQAAAVRPFGHRHTPPPPTPASVPDEAEPEDEAEEESHLLRSPDALLKRRESRWVDAAQLLRSGAMPLAQPPKKVK